MSRDMKDEHMRIMQRINANVELQQKIREPLLAEYRNELKKRSESVANVKKYNAKINVGFAAAASVFNLGYYILLGTDKITGKNIYSDACQHELSIGYFMTCIWLPLALQVIFPAVILVGGRYMFLENAPQAFVSTLPENPTYTFAQVIDAIDAITGTITSIPEELTCPITLRLITTPCQIIRRSDGALAGNQAYEQSALVEWLKLNPKIPTTNEPFNLNSAVEILRA